MQFNEIGLNSDRLLSLGDASRDSASASNSFLCEVNSVCRTEIQSRRRGTRHLMRHSCNYFKSVYDDYH